MEMEAKERRNFERKGVCTCHGGADELEGEPELITGELQEGLQQQLASDMHGGALGR
jgi:hypothetical protein